jgi:Glycogen recognition site of AMP-activated protein kinase
MSLEATRGVMRLVLLAIALVACRPPGYGKGGGGGDDAVDIDAAVVTPDAAPGDTAAAICTKAFRLDGHSLATAVSLTGSFVSWSGTAPPAIAFTKGLDGAWTGSYDFAAGMHQYKYIVDGSWIPDPTNPNQVDDTFGGFNSVINCAP